MSIRRVRIAFENQFVQIPNAWMRDERLSRRARGLLAEIMTHDAGWEITIDSLVAKGPEGRHALRAAIKELEDAGYLRRKQQTANGRFGAMDYILQDPLISGVGKSDDGKTDIGASALKNTILEEDHLEEKREKRSRALTTLPADFTVTESMATWARTDTPGIDLVSETEKFRNYYQAKGTTFKDWAAAWRNWMLREVGYSKNNSSTQNASAGEWHHHSLDDFDPYEGTEYARR